MIKWENYFDAVFCIHYLVNKNRMPYLKAELERVGLLNNKIFSFRYSVPCSYDRIIADVAMSNQWISQAAYANLSLCELRLLKECSLVGMSRILILEDDIAFLKDLERVERIISSMPDTVGICQLDKAIGGRDCDRWKEDVQSRKYNDFFVVSPYNYPFATCNSYTAAGMAEAIEVLENRLCSPDRITTFTKSDTAIAIQNIGIQVLYDNACNLKYGDAKKLWERYQSQQINLFDYAVPEGYKGKETYGEKQ